MSDQEEKLGAGSAPAYDNHSKAEQGGAALHQENTASTTESWATRNGLSAKSFQRKDYGTGIIELERRMKPRHLNMIAIGTPRRRVSTSPSLDSSLTY